ncbi:hypothetical protein HDU92_001237 [Lobulomyces angularis]|nr:hypothetical protein HDU92_001237 [Lobulomyces angularis]
MQHGITLCNPLIRALKYSAILKMKWLKKNKLSLEMIKNRIREASLTFISNDNVKVVEESANQLHERIRTEGIKTPNRPKEFLRHLNSVNPNRNEFKRSELANQSFRKNHTPEHYGWMTRDGVSIMSNDSAYLDSACTTTIFNEKRYRNPTQQWPNPCSTLTKRPKTNTKPVLQLQGLKNCYFKTQTFKNLTLTLTMSNNLDSIKNESSKDKSSLRYTSQIKEEPQVDSWMEDRLIIKDLLKQLQLKDEQLKKLKFNEKSPPPLTQSLNKNVLKMVDNLA